MQKAHIQNGDIENHNAYVKERKSGCYVSVKGWVSIMVVTALLIAGTALTTYFLAVGDGGAVPIVGEDPYNGLPPPPEIIVDERETYDGYLSRDLLPAHYDVTLKTYLDAGDGTKQFTFEGSAAINITCQKPTSAIVLHAHQSLAVDHDSVVVTTADGTVVPHSDVQENAKYDYLEIHLAPGSVLAAGEVYRVGMSFVGTLLQPDLMGYYLSNYTKNGEVKHLAATQLETVNARRVFPCFDEPTFKATFQFTLIHRNTRKALWNMRMTDTVADETGQWNTTHFEKTNVVMSTYLNAIVIADYVSREEVTPNNVLLRVWADENDIHAADYCLQTGFRQLKFFEEFWQIDYPLPKLDIVAIPDFYFGAMENWGLILTRSDYFLYDPEKQEPSVKWSVAAINSHEIAHKWFGNLVTTAWWDNIWLNEGLTSYFEHVGCQNATPEFDNFEQLYQRDDVFPAFAADAKGSSHPVVVPDIGWPDETWFLFDTISYQKGSALTRMMRQFLGEETFKTGLVNYLTKHAYGNVVSDDLFAVLTETDKGGNNYNVKLIMDTWIRQMGYPMVNVTVTFNDDGQSASVHTTQQHFLLDPEDAPDPRYFDFGYKWYVPLTYTHSAQLDNVKPMEIWQNMGPVDFAISGITKEDFVLVNINQTGFYRVNYDVENWNKIAERLVTDHTVFTITNRAALLEDAFNIGRALLLDQVVAWKLTQYLVRETEYNPWNTVLSNIWYTSNLLKGKSAYGYMEQYVQMLITPLYGLYGWDFSEEYLVYENTVSALETACVHGNPDCIQHSIQLFSKWMKDPANYTIPTYLKTTVYCTAIKHGGQPEWDFAWQMYEDANTTVEDKVYLISAMACTKDSWKLARYLETALDQLWIYEAITYALYHSPVDNQYIWAFTLDNFELILQFYEDMAYDIIWQFANFMSTETEKRQLEDFGKKYKDMPSTAAEGFYDALRQVDLNSMWMERNHDDLHSWFRSVTMMI